MQATVRSVWMDIFLIPEHMIGCTTFLEYLEWMFSRMQWARNNYPGFLTIHAVSFTEATRAEGRKEIVFCTFAVYYAACTQK